MTPGVYLGMSNHDYHADPAIGSTTVKSISISPANLYLNPFKGNKSSHIGSAVHSALLEPAAFDSEYVLRDDITSRASADYKALKAVTDPEKVIIGSGVETVNKMIWSAGMNEDFTDYLSSPGASEISMFATCPETGLQLKCRFDRLSDNHPYPLDVKTCKDATERGFSQAFGRFHYHVQAAFYLYVLKLATGRDLNQFCFFALENGAPFKNCMYYIGEDSLNLGYKVMFDSLRKLKQCIDDESLRNEGLVLPSNEINVPAYLLDDEYSDEVYL
ncbi:PD-(D/E)XK nuclease-like domain-containing protein [Scandinavium sp. H11S7]|uniref:PD-(D/E)XK nuclease-like domain-containing protein n=1 Tax=Scandinavium hiltneri TaxID=2926519 RepID=A0ABT2E1D2_9ENTR|nr:PD-(D/E)XK nuclease-like domain-containing protein [Scandinavium hiltneri]MCS2161695.1 PD-(D/E)XK nuclease-like domain-containing protein [Scandinavium hiltneri]